MWKTPALLLTAVTGTLQSVQAQQKPNVLVYMQGLYATTCDLAGIPVPGNVDFPSLMPQLRDRKAPGEKYIFGGYRHLQRMIRSDRYKLTVYPQAKEMQLFDLKKDPDEKMNLADEAKYAPVREQMLAELKKEQQKLGDKLMIK